MSLLNCNTDELSSDECVVNETTLFNNVTEVGNVSGKFSTKVVKRDVDLKNNMSDGDDRSSEDLSEDDIDNYSDHFGRYLLGFGECDTNDINKEIKRRFKIVDKRLRKWTGDSDTEDLMAIDVRASTWTPNQSRNNKTSILRHEDDDLDNDDIEEFLKMNKELFGLENSDLKPQSTKVHNDKESKDTSIMNTVFSSIKSYKTAGRKSPQSKFIPSKI